MKHWHLLTFLLLGIVFPQLAQADEEYYPEVSLLFASDLAVEASFVKTDGDYFWIKVKTVYRQVGHQVKPHDFIRIKQHRERYVTGYYDFSIYERGRFYLQYESNTWSLEGSTSQAVKRMINDSVWFDFYRDRIALQADEFNLLYKEFVKHYTLSPERRSPVTTLSADELEAYKKSNAFIKAYENDLNGEVLTVISSHEVSEPPTPPNPTPINCNLTETPPEFNKGAGSTALYEYLAENMIQPFEMKELGVEGRSFAKLIVHSDGSQSDIEILRSLGASFDQEVLRLVEGFPKWKPAQQSGKDISCEYVFPIVFKIEK